MQNQDQFINYLPELAQAPGPVRAEARFRGHRSCMDKAYAMTLRAGTPVEAALRDRAVTR